MSFYSRELQVTPTFFYLAVKYVKSIILLLFGENKSDPKLKDLLHKLNKLVKQNADMELTFKPEWLQVK